MDKLEQIHGAQGIKAKVILVDSSPRQNTVRRGVYFYFCPPPPKKNRVVDLFGKNLMFYFIKKTENIWGKRLKNGEKWDIFTVLGGKISFWRKREGQKYHILGNIYTQRPVRLSHLVLKITKIVFIDN